jgi:hypothetical protein
VLFCPAAPPRGNPGNVPNPPGKADTAWTWTISSPPYGSSYGINKWLAISGGLGNSSAHPNYLYRTAATVRYPAQVPAYMDAAWINFDPLETDHPARNLYDPLGSASQVSTSSVDEGMPRVCVSRHGGRPAGSAPRSVLTGTPLVGAIEVGFNDGHADQVLLNNLWTYYWHLNWQTPAMRPP